MHISALIIMNYSFQLHEAAGLICQLLMVADELPKDQ